METPACFALARFQFTKVLRTESGFVAALHDGPTLVSHQQDLLDELVVLVVQPVGDVFLHVGRHVRVTLAQEGVDHMGVWQGTGYKHVFIDMRHSPPRGGVGWGGGVFARECYQ